MAQDFCEHTDIRTSATHIRATQVSHKMDKLAERIGVLTIPRERDNVPEGLVDSLPPEGENSSSLFGLDLPTFTFVPVF